MSGMDPMMAAGMGMMPLFAAMTGGTYIAPPAGEEGGPPGYNPYEPAAEVLIDPDVYGDKAVIRPREITQEAMKRVLQSRLKPNQQLSERRLAASDAMYELVTSQTQRPLGSAGEKVGAFSPVVIDTGRGESVEATPLPGQPLVPEATEVHRPMRSPRSGLQGQHADSVVPMQQAAAQPVAAMPVKQAAAQPAMLTAAGNYPLVNNAGQVVGYSEPEIEQATPLTLPVIEDGQPPPRQFPAGIHGGLRQASRAAAAAAAPAPATSAMSSVSPPNICVDFEVDGNPFTMQGWYHKVVRSGSSIILVFDDRCQGYPRVFPPMIETPMAMRVRGQSKIFSIMSAGHHFTMEVVPGLKLEMDILLITEEHEVQQ